ncbi:uncharacterized protein [Dermacentor andersoni]|uniref:uncharacterized protein n=1 Tax=Dermacentor andersoni TaxID=34620 RepID=UPI003B3B2C70
MEHAFLSRINRFLEDNGLYPPTMVGFRLRLSTQYVMLQLYHQIINNPTSGNRAILCLDLEKTFDNVAHAAILSRINKLSMATGRYILQELGFNYHVQHGHKQVTSPDLSDTLIVAPIPRNMHSEYNRGQRQAHVKALLRSLGGKRTMRFVDAAEYTREPRS